MSDSDGLLLLRKPANVTSFAVLGPLKKRLLTQKVGHTGTLDKFAEGLLVVLTGNYTKLTPFISDLDKHYRAVFEFGKRTTTLDPEGDVVETGPLPTEEALLKNRSAFLGSIRQCPPEFSAVHLGGKRAYERALRGERVTMPERSVRIDEFEILEWTPPYLRVSVRCGKGTYIRSLARDYGQICGTCAYVKRLERIAVGTFELADAVAPEDFDPGTSLKRGSSVLRHLFPEGSLVLRDRFLPHIRSGKTIFPDFFENPPQGHGPFPVFSATDRLLALIERRGEGFAYRFVTV